MIVKHDSVRLAMIVLTISCLTLVAGPVLAASTASTPWETPNEKLVPSHLLLVGLDSFDGWRN